MQIEVDAEGMDDIVDRMLQDYIVRVGARANRMWFEAASDTGANTQLDE